MIIEFWFAVFGCVKPCKQHPCLTIKPLLQSDSAAIRV